MESVATPFEAFRQAPAVEGSGDRSRAQEMEDRIFWEEVRAAFDQIAADPGESAVT